MKRIISFIISSIVIGISLSFGSYDSVSVSGLMVGQKTPAMDSRKEKEGDLILINFWAAYDAASRDENVRFSSAIKKRGARRFAGNRSFKSVSVSMDKYESIFEEVVKQDDLNFSEVMRESDGFQSELAKALKLNNRLGNLLVDGRGKVIAKDLTPVDLEKVLRRY